MNVIPLHVDLTPEGTRAELDGLGLPVWFLAECFDVSRQTISRWKRDGKQSWRRTELVNYYSRLAAVRKDSNWTPTPNRIESAQNIMEAPKTPTKPSK